MASEIRNRFTDTEMQIARETDLPELLTHLGYQVKRIGRYHTTAEMDSLRIKDRRTWFRYSRNTGGDAITFLQQYCGKFFPEAVEYLLTFHGKARDAPVPQPKAINPKQEFFLPPRNADDRRVFAYLRKRGIAAQVIRQFLNAGLLYEDAVHHNCVFVGRDESGQAKYAGLRGTYDLDGPGFKGDAPGSDKNTGFSLPHDPQSDLVCVFEAPIDLMSYLTLHRDTVNAVALCGLYDGALRTYLQTHPEIHRMESVSPSPFDYRNNCLLYLPQNPPRQRTEDTDVYFDELTAEIVGLIKAASGHALVLFTSYAAMSAVKDRLREESLPFSLLTLGRNAPHIIEQFRHTPGAVLLATGAAWEGFDFPGDCVSLLIIPRLPFAYPDARKERELEKYPSLRTFIREVAVPEMQIKLRQGFGRAIRTESDTCVIAILDERACRGRRYAQAVSEALPEMRRTGSLREVTKFLREKKPESYFEVGR